MRKNSSFRLYQISIFLILAGFSNTGCQSTDQPLQETPNRAIGSSYSTSNETKSPDEGLPPHTPPTQVEEFTSDDTASDNTDEGANNTDLNPTPPVSSNPIDFQQIDPQKADQKKEFTSSLKENLNSWYTQFQLDSSEGDVSVKRQISSPFHRAFNFTDKNHGLLAQAHQFRLNPDIYIENKYKQTLWTIKRSSSNSVKSRISRAFAKFKGNTEEQSSDLAADYTVLDAQGEVAYLGYESPDKNRIEFFSDEARKEKSFQLVKTPLDENPSAFYWKTTFFHEMIFDGQLIPATIAAFLVQDIYSNKKIRTAAITAGAAAAITGAVFLYYYFTDPLFLMNYTYSGLSNYDARKAFVGLLNELLKTPKQGIIDSMESRSSSVSAKAMYKLQDTVRIAAEKLYQENSKWFSDKISEISLITPDNILYLIRCNWKSVDFGSSPCIIHAVVNDLQRSGF